MEKMIVTFFLEYSNSSGKDNSDINSETTAIYMMLYPQLTQPQRIS